MPGVQRRQSAKLKDNVDATVRKYALNEVRGMAIASAYDPEPVHDADEPSARLVFPIDRYGQVATPFPGSTAGIYRPDASCPPRRLATRVPFCRRVGAPYNSGHMVRTSRLLALPFCLAGCASPGVGDALVVGAAASLSEMLPALTGRFGDETDITITATIGATGQLAQQIRQGAPIDILLAADAASVDALVAEGLILPGSRAIYARGRLAMWSRDAGARLARIEDLVSEDIRRIAIAHPEHAPYGRAGREALVSAGIWEEVEHKVVIAENVRQALQFAETGNADVAIVALTVVHDAGGITMIVDDSLYTPLEHALGAVTGGDRTSATRFLAFVLSPAGQEVLGRFGFMPANVPVK